MAIGAIHLRQFSDVDRMLKVSRGQCGGKGGRTFGLRQHRVALVAIAADHTAICTDVLPVVAAETSRRIKVSKIVGMRLPVQLHFRERGPLEDLLHFGDRVANFQLLGLCDIRIFFLVEILEAAGDALHGRVVRVVCSRQNGDSLLLDEGEGIVEAMRQQGLVDGEIGRHVDMGRAIMAIDAIHAVRGVLGDLGLDLIFGQG